MGEKVKLPECFAIMLVLLFSIFRLSEEEKISKEREKKSLSFCLSAVSTLGSLTSVGRRGDQKMDELKMPTLAAAIIN